MVGIRRGVRRGLLARVVHDERCGLDDLRGVDIVARYRARLLVWCRGVWWNYCGVVEMNLQHYINQSAAKYPSIFGSRFSVLVHLFTVLGNGERLDEETGLFVKHDVTVPVDHRPAQNPRMVRLYPWSDAEEYQPFRKMLGNRYWDFRDQLDFFTWTVKNTDPQSINAETYAAELGRKSLPKAGILRDRYTEEADRYRGSLVDWQKNIGVVERLFEATE